MFENLLRIIPVVITMWIISIKYIGSVQIPTTLEEYNQNLNIFKRRVINENVSPFAKWTSVSSNDIGVHTEQKYKAILGNFPPGMNGQPVFLDYNTKNPLRAIVQQGWRDHAFNEYVSDIIPVNRTVPDYRDEWCRTRNYSDNLPQASVVITFHNEAWSTLIRTVNTVIKQSPEHLLKEIVLFDDYSDMSHLRGRLTEHVKFLPKVKLYRSPYREGLIRGRIRALKLVTSPVVVFLDSHVECAEGWLEPLLERIAQDPTKVVSPVVDIIHRKTFEYIPQEVNDLRIGGFNWELKFIWQTIPKKILRERKQLSAPIMTPTISGGLFAINKDFFKKLRYFDEEFDYWGAENLELSFKTWMCGGSLEIVPCSRVGHVFRKKYPYTRFKGAVRRNFIRLAAIWMDQYAKYFYERIGFTHEIDIGDITEWKLLRQKLNCKSFKWYLSKIYPQIELPDKYVAFGKIYGLSGDNLCLDSRNQLKEFTDSVSLLRCHHMGGNQFWMYTKGGEIKRDKLCLDDFGNNRTVSMNTCNGRLSQVWIYFNNTQQFLNMASKLCLGAKKPRFQDGWSIVLQPCSKSHRQTWGLDNYKGERQSRALQNFANKTGTCIDL